MHFVDDSEVNRVLSFPILIEAIEAAHRRPKIAVHDSYLGDDKGQQLVTRSAVDAGRFMMTKLYTSFPGNLAHGKLCSAITTTSPPARSPAGCRPTTSPSSRTLAAGILI